MSRTLIHGQVDRLIAECWPVSALTLEVLRAGLNAVFAGGRHRPYAFFLNISFIDEQLVAEVEAPEDERDIEQWCVALDDYLDRRIRIVPAGADDAPGMRPGIISSRYGYML